jgi:homoserine O-acetyltransferase
MQAASFSAAGPLRRLAGLAVLALVALFAPGARAETKIFIDYDFPFEDGSILPELRIAYETQGTLSPARDNAVVLLHDALADRHAFDAWVGPGKPFDTDRYFVVAIDAIGAGESSSPGDGRGQDFPRYTIGDAAAADHALLSRGLGLTRLRAVVRTVIDLLTETVAFDSDWAGGRNERDPLEGLRHAGMIYYPWSVSTAYLDALPLR